MSYETLFFDRCTEVAMAYAAWYAQVSEKIEKVAASLPSLLPLDVRIDIAIGAKGLGKAGYKYMSQKKPITTSTCSSM